MKKNITSLFFCLSIGTAVAQTSTSGQSTLPNIIPPSAESYKLGTFGNIPVSLFTGNANVNIPLTSYETKNIKLPITLSYSSNGIKVDDMNGSTGLGWTLNAGGVITRIIRDLPDEDNQSATIVPENIDGLGVNHPTIMQFFQDASYGDVDTEQDLYMANFNGIQIKFVFNRKGIPVIYSQKDVIIEGKSGGPSFTITTDDGMKYYFTDEETTSNRTSGDGHSMMSVSASAWYLTKIEDIATGETVFIENADGGYSTTISQSQTLSYTSPTGGTMYSGCGNPPFIRYPQVSELISHNQTVNGKQIKRIYSSNPAYGEILFDYTQYSQNTDFKSLTRVVKKLGNIIINNIDLTYNFTGNKRLFLTSVNDNIPKALHQFEYINPQEFPVRLAFSKDAWGYYNGIPYNTNLVPKIDKLTNWASYQGAITAVIPEKTEIGMLKKIIYPTKGSSEFFYENHTKIEKNALLSEAEFTGVQIKATSDDNNTNVTNSVTFTPIKSEEIRLGGGASFNSQQCDSNDNVPGKHRAVANLRKANGQLVELYSKSPSGVVSNIGVSATFPGLVDSFYAYAQKDEPLTLSLRTLFVCVRSTVAATYTEKEAVYGDKVVPIGGLRIARIVDTTENGMATTRKFVYKDLNEQTSEAEIVRTPEFEEIVRETRICYTYNHNLGVNVPNGVERFPYYAVTSSNINQLYATHPNVFYKTVQEIVEGKSNIIHKYSTDTDVFGNVLYGNNIRNSQWTNAGWKNGREIFTKYLDGNNNLVRTVEMNYTEDPSRKYQVDGFSIRKNYDNPLTQNVSKTCKAEDVTRVTDVTYCSTSHNHKYPSVWSKNCVAIGANNVTQQYKDICYGKAVGEVIAFDDYLDNLDIMQYKNISYFEYLKSQKITDYLNGKEMKTETEYFYTNPSHTQLNKKKTIHPDLSVDEISYQYALEKGNQLMIDKNMVSIPLETQVTQTTGNTTKILSKTETIYPSALPHAVAGNLVLPLSLQSYNMQTPTEAQTEVTYDRYDDKGNILQYTTKDGVPVSVVWGYNKTLPIIKIEGIAYSQIENMISTYIADSDADALDPTKEPLLLIGYQRLRKDLSLVGKLITTYSYDPLIGVTSITPPSGILEKYVYDTANRLQKVEDLNGRIIKEYQYHYKN
ncbi:hypothetical protein [Chryseobacterium indologenes]|uniref:RHS repeat protein n=1 Tax=Chryseobacterium indologenes TaxID=253 RepID=A0A0N0ZRY0_CHRID|nr:hypothetical protein [Chryseobacterium indologenes]KPE48988.1 hypothetical protein AOB46_22450 [Chryseobacterium indologenes]